MTVTIVSLGPVLGIVEDEPVAELLEAPLLVCWFDADELESDVASGVPLPLSVLGTLLVCELSLPAVTGFLSDETPWTIAMTIPVISKTTMMIAAISAAVRLISILSATR